jgi:hypothetical protein
MLDGEKAGSESDRRSICHMHQALLPRTGMKRHCIPTLFIQEETAENHDGS